MKKSKAKIFYIIIFIILFISCQTGYHNDGKQVTFHWWNEGSGHSHITIKADPNTFEELGDDYGKDIQNVFLSGRIIKNANGATFKYLGHNYAIDDSHVFHYDTIISKASPKSFQVHSICLSEDENDFFWKGNPIFVSDKKTFIVLGDINDWNTSWAKDKNYAYYFGGKTKRIKLYDYKSFKPLKNKKWQRSNYASDNKYVYFKDSIVYNADPTTFKVVDYSIGQDKKCVYHKWLPTNIKDYNKLSPIGKMYTDGYNIYTNDLIELNNADITTFKNIDNSNWYIDRNHIWWQSLLVDSADTETFEPIYLYSFFGSKKHRLAGASFNYGKDAFHVYYRDSIIIGADPKTFEIIDFNDQSSWCVFDKNRIYSGKKSTQLIEYLHDKYNY